MSKEYQKIIVRMPNWIGDAVMATPILEDLKNKWPKATLTVMGLKPISSLLLGNPFVDEVFCFSKPNSFLRREEHRDIISRLRQGKYDLGILLTNSFSSAWWFWRGHIKERVGYAGDGRSFLLTKAPRFPKERGSEHLVTTYKRLLLPLDIPLSSTSPQLYLREEEKEHVKNQLLKRGHTPGNRIVGINPGAAYGSAKCWLPERFRAVTERLLGEKDITILYFGDQGTAPLIKDICKGLPSQVINLAGETTLRELIAYISICDAFLTNDSGPMHIAAALKTPLVALFGSTNDTATGPYQHGKVIHKHVACSPCYRRTCPIDFRCMKQIEIDEVFTSLKELLDRV